jgi:cytochrome c6
MTIIRNYRVGLVALLPLFLLAIPHSAAAQAGKPEQGRKLFNQICVKCHAADGSGDTPIGKAVGAKDLRAAEAQKLTDAEIFTQIYKGNGNMPSLSDAINQAREDDLKDRVNDLVAYIRELGKKPPVAKKH